MTRADGSVRINVIADESQAIKVLNALSRIEKQVMDINSQTNRNGKDAFRPLDEGAQKAEKSTSSLFKAMLGSKVVVTAMGMIKDSVGAAISRFDTMKSFPRMMENLGFTSEQSERSIRKLAQGIEGLPTRLDEVVATTQQITNITDDLNYATDLTLALNNAFLSSGSSAADASRGLTQYTQMLASGKVDMQSWRTLQETMGVGLKKVANEFGFLGTSAVPDLYAALQSGDITFRDFSLKLIELDKAAGGFAETAAIGSQGIATSWQNIKTAVVNGVAGIITIFDENSQKMTGAGIAAGLDLTKIVVKKAFEMMQVAIKAFMPVLNAVIGAITLLVTNFDNLKPAIAGTIVAITGLMIIANFTTIVKAAELAWIAFRIAMLDLSAATTTVIASLGKLATVLMAHPVLAVGAIIAGVLVGIAVSLSRVSDEQQKFIDSSERAVESSKRLSDAVRTSNENWGSNLSYLDANAKSMENVTAKTIELANNQTRGAKGTKELKENIAELNQYIGEEIVLYDEKTKGINLSAEALQSYISVASEQQKLAAIQEEINRLDKEKIEIDIQKKANEELLAEARRKYQEEHYVYRDKNKKAIQELEQANNELTAAEEVNAASTKAALELKEEALNSSVKAEERLREAIKNRGITIEDLDEKERKVVDNMKERYNSLVDATTSMFDKINTKSKLSKEEMLENLRANQEAVANWAENMAILAERGVNQGMLEQLRRLGPEGGGEVAELVKMTDDELAEFNSLFSKAPVVAMDNMTTAFGIEKSKIPPAIYGLVTEADTSMSQGFNGIDWSQYANNVVDGFNSGIYNNVESAKKAVSSLASGAKSEFTGSLEIKSPSRVFVRYGEFVAEGLKNGLEKSRAFVSKAMDTLKKIFNVQTSLKQAGTNAGQGFLSGLSGMTNSIMSKARNIANSVVSTIKNALKIKSPSRITMELGEFTGEGLEVGLDNTINSIKNKAKQLAESAVPKIDRNSLYNTGKQFVGQGITNNTSTQTTNSAVFNVNKIEWHGKDDIRKTMDEMGWIAGQNKMRLAYE